MTHVRRHHAHYHTRGGGHLYQGRFKSFPIEADRHFLQVCRYVESNALRAGLVKRAEDWPWCSLGWPERAPRVAPELRPDLEIAAWPVKQPRAWAMLVNERLPEKAVGDLEQQMKNAHADLRKVLAHYGCSFDDVIVENVFTTDMAKFLEVSAYRNEIYAKQFPAGSWLEVKGLALPELMIEIELEAHRGR